MNRPATAFILLTSAFGLLPLHAQTEPTPIAFSEIGAKATADYQGEAIRIERTADGARLHTGFQKLAGTVTPEGLTLESTEEGGGILQLTATTFGRAYASGAPLPATGSVTVGEKSVTWTRPGLI